MSDKCDKVGCNRDADYTLKATDGDGNVVDENSACSNHSDLLVLIKEDGSQQSIHEVLENE